MEKFKNKLKGMKWETFLRLFSIYYLRFSQVMVVVHLILLSSQDYSTFVFEGKVADFIYGILNFFINIVPVNNAIMLDLVYIPISPWAAPIWVFYIVFVIQASLVIGVMEVIIRALIGLGKQPMDYGLLIKRVNIIGVIFLVLYTVSFIGTLIPELTIYPIQQAITYSLSTIPAQHLLLALIAFLISAMIKEQKSLREEVEAVI